VGNDCFGLQKILFLLEEALAFLLEEGIQQKGFINL
jgi:hypothetical protein